MTSQVFYHGATVGAGICCQTGNALCMFSENKLSLLYFHEWNGLHSSLNLDTIAVVQWQFITISSWYFLKFIVATLASALILFKVKFKKWLQPCVHFDHKLKELKPLVLSHMSIGI